MQQENIRYVQVWSAWLRLSHWLMAGGVLFQISSAWALAHDEVDYNFWLDWHIMTGQVVLMALALRVILFFFPGSGNWRTFIPERAQFRTMLQMIKFYLSLGRFPLPNWYAHNPLWLPVYPVFFLVLAGCLLSGLLYDASLIVFGTPVFELHAALAGLITAFTIFHIAAVFLHDLKGKGACISAMVNGFRYFHHTAMSEQVSSDLSGKLTVSVDSIKRQHGSK